MPINRETILNRISAAKNNLITAVAYHQDSRQRDLDQAARIPKTAEIYLEYAKRCKKCRCNGF